MQGNDEDVVCDDLKLNMHHINAKDPQFDLTKYQKSPLIPYVAPTSQTPFPPVTNGIDIEKICQNLSKKMNVTARQLYDGVLDVQSNFTSMNYWIQYVRDAKDPKKNNDIFECFKLLEKKVTSSFQGMILHLFTLVVGTNSQALGALFLNLVCKKTDIHPIFFSFAKFPIRDSQLFLFKPVLEWQRQNILRIVACCSPVLNMHSIGDLDDAHHLFRLDLSGLSSQNLHVLTSICPRDMLFGSLKLPPPLLHESKLSPTEQIYVHGKRTSLETFKKDLYEVLKKRIDRTFFGTLKFPKEIEEEDDVFQLFGPHIVQTYKKHDMFLCRDVPCIAMILCDGNKEKSLECMSTCIFDKTLSKSGSKEINLIVFSSFPNDMSGLIYKNMISNKDLIEFDPKWKNAKSIPKNVCNLWVHSKNLKKISKLGLKFWFVFVYDVSSLHVGKQDKNIHLLFDQTLENCIQFDAIVMFGSSFAMPPKLVNMLPFTHFKKQFGGLEPCEMNMNMSYFYMNHVLLFQEQEDKKLGSSLCDEGDKSTSQRQSRKGSQKKAPSEGVEHVAYQRASRKTENVGRQRSSSKASVTDEVDSIGSSRKTENVARQRSSSKTSFTDEVNSIARQRSSRKTSVTNDNNNNNNTKNKPKIIRPHSHIAIAPKETNYANSALLGLCESNTQVANIVLVNSHPQLCFLSANILLQCDAEKQLFLPILEEMHAGGKFIGSHIFHNIMNFQSCFGNLDVLPNDNKNSECFDNACCLICTQHLATSGVVILPCKHTFCSFCLKKWQCLIPPLHCPCCKIQKPQIYNMKFKNTQVENASRKTQSSILLKEVDNNDFNNSYKLEYIQNCVFAKPVLIITQFQRVQTLYKRVLNNHDDDGSQDNCHIICVWPDIPNEYAHMRVFINDFSLDNIDDMLKKFSRPDILLSKNGLDRIAWMTYIQKQTFANFEQQLFLLGCPTQKYFNAFKILDDILNVLQRESNIRVVLAEEDSKTWVDYKTDIIPRLNIKGNELIVNFETNSFVVTCTDPLELKFNDQVINVSDISKIQLAKLFSKFVRFHNDDLFANLYEQSRLYWQASITQGKIAFFFFYLMCCVRNFTNFF